MPFCIYAQAAIENIENHITEGNYKKATAILKENIEDYTTQKKADSLPRFIFYTGKLTALQKSSLEAKRAVYSLIADIKKMRPSQSVIVSSYLEAGEFFNSVGNYKEAYHTNVEALKILQSGDESTYNKYGQIHNNLATYAQKMGNLSLSRSHTEKALAYLQKATSPDYELLYICYNGLGSNYYYMSNTDSATFYYEKALNILEKTERNARNSFFRPAIILNNLAGIYRLEGKLSKAIPTLYNCIDHLNQFVASPEPDVKKNYTETFLAEAIDNLGGIYRELGNLSKAKELLEFSYEKKRTLNPPDSTALFISEILLGQLFFDMREYQKATRYLTNALGIIDRSDNDYLFWQADGYYTLALLSDAQKAPSTAANYYAKADSLYNESLQGEYDVVYLELMRNQASFFARNNQPEKALQLAQKSYQYVLKNQSRNSLIFFDELINLAEIYYLQGNYQKALSISTEGLAITETRNQVSQSLLDSIRVNLKKPQAILQKSKAQYALLQEKEEGKLKKILKDLEEALQIMEQQKSLFTNASDIDLLIANNRDLIAFAKFISKELFLKNNQEFWLNKLMSYHESEIYNKLRARLDKNDSIRYAHISESIQKEEKQIKDAMSNALLMDDSGQGMATFRQTEIQWNQFIKKLKKEQPKYYELRYASIFKNIPKISEFIPPNTQVVRYLFIDKELYALVATNETQAFIPLQTSELESAITAVSMNQLSEAETLETLYKLYLQLWQPIESHLTNQKIILIPDGILYNLNFEILTPVKINRYQALADHSLLTRHVISYHYSLFLSNPPARIHLSNPFIGFAPGFTSESKKRYSLSLTKTDVSDKAYLSLLPQPFSIQLLKKIQPVLGGKMFVEDSSTIEAFKNYAANNKIIHISTHAEFDNNSPGYSRLIFSKRKGTENNSLFADELFNFDLTSNLAVITGCETGRPGYKDGEGMLSLAHAFHYAGSESMITGLWKIDEQASTILLEDFYKNIRSGMHGDEALQKSKVQYLKNADGRMLAPQYWAGLIYIGNPSPIEFKQTMFDHFLPFFIPVLLIYGGWILWKRSRVKKAFF